MTETRKAEIVQFCIDWGLHKASHKRLLTVDDRVLQYVLRKFSPPHDELGKDALLVAFANSVLKNQIKRDGEVQGNAALAASTLRENEVWARYQAWGDSTGWIGQTDVTPAAEKVGGAASSSWQGDKGWPRQAKVPSPPVKAGVGMHNQWLLPKRERSRTPRGRTK